MLILQKKRVRELKSNLPAILADKSLILAVPTSKNGAALKKLGFSEPITVGETILPNAVGPVTRFNAYGRDLIRRDLAKETVTRSALWTREQWKGRGETETVTDIVYRTYKRFPRQHIEGTQIELVIIEKDGEKFVTMLQPVRYNDENAELLRTGINIFLEVFGQVMIFDEAMEPIEIPASLKSLNWRILPPGKKITKEQLEEALKTATSRSKNVRAAEIARQDMLSGFQPAVIAVGQGGFTGYVAYVFEDSKLTLLESLRYGNATYILDLSKWEELSKLTKQQLVSNNLAKGREVHTEHWVDRIKKILGR